MSRSSCMSRSNRHVIASQKASHSHQVKPSHWLCVPVTRAVTQDQPKPACFQTCIHSGIFSQSHSRASHLRHKPSPSMRPTSQSQDNHPSKGNPGAIPSSSKHPNPNNSNASAAELTSIPSPFFSLSSSASCQSYELNHASNELTALSSTPRLLEPMARQPEFWELARI